MLRSPDDPLVSSSGGRRQSQESWSNISVASSHMTDDVGADGFGDSTVSIWSFMKVSLSLHVPLVKGLMARSDSEFVGY